MKIELKKITKWWWFPFIDKEIMLSIDGKDYYLTKGGYWSFFDGEMPVFHWYKDDNKQDNKL
jgi:hypothetical protein